MTRSSEITNDNDYVAIEVCGHSKLALIDYFGKSVSEDF